MKTFYKQFEEELNVVNSFLEQHFSVSPLCKKSCQHQAIKELQVSMEYTLLNGGKRFRPLLSLLAAKSLNVSYQDILPFAAAVEMVHTYSLIHDDLPCMDNDELRRGVKSNHLVHGEAMALLAGDALQTEAFSLIARGYESKPKVVCTLVKLLADAIGWQGMAGGQVIDVKALSGAEVSYEDITLMHKLKTGALIAVAIDGVCAIANASPNVKKYLSEYAKNLGFSFQIADDLMDYSEVSPEPQSLTTLLGVEKTEKLLDETLQKARECLVEIGLADSPLSQMIDLVGQQVDNG